MKNKNILYIPYLTKKYPVFISQPTDPDIAEIETAIFVECPEAGFAQIWDTSDLPLLLAEVLPQEIKNRRKSQKLTAFNIRITAEEKYEIEERAQKSGYTSVSAYMRDRALGVSQ